MSHRSHSARTRSNAIQHAQLWKNAQLFRSLLAPAADMDKARDFFVCAIGVKASASAAPGEPGQQAPSAEPATVVSPPLSPAVKATFPAQPISSVSPQVYRPAPSSTSSSGRKPQQQQQDDLHSDPLDLEPLPPPIGITETAPSIAGIALVPAPAAVAVGAVTMGGSGGRAASTCSSSEPNSPSKGGSRSAPSAATASTVAGAAAPTNATASGGRQSPEPNFASASASSVTYRFFVGRKDSALSTRASRPPFHVKTATPLCPFFVPPEAALGVSGVTMMVGGGGSSNNNSSMLDDPDAPNIKSTTARPAVKPLQQQQLQQQHVQQQTMRCPHGSRCEYLHVVGGGSAGVGGSGANNGNAGTGTRADDDDDDDDNSSLRQHHHLLHGGNSSNNVPALRLVPALAELALRLQDDQVTVRTERRLLRVPLADCDPTAGLSLLLFLLCEGAILSGALRVCIYHGKGSGCRHKNLCLYAHINGGAAGNAGPGGAVATAAVGSGASKKTASKSQPSPQVQASANAVKGAAGGGGSSVAAPSSSQQQISASTSSAASSTATALPHSSSRDALAPLGSTSTTTPPQTTGPGSPMIGAASTGGSGGPSSFVAEGKSPGASAVVSATSSIGGAVNSSFAAMSGAGSTNFNDRMEASTPLTSILAMALPSARYIAPVAGWWAGVGVHTVGDVQQMSKDVFNSMTQVFFAKASLEPAAASAATGANDAATNGALVSQQQQQAIHGAKSNCLLALEALRVLPASTPISTALLMFHNISNSDIQRFSAAHPAIATVGDLARARLKNLLLSPFPPFMPVQLLLALEQIRARHLQDENVGPQAIRLTKCGALHRILTDIVLGFRTGHAHDSWRKSDPRRPIVTSAITFVDPTKCKCNPYSSGVVAGDGSIAVGGGDSGGGGGGNLSRTGSATQMMKHPHLFPSEPPLTVASDGPAAADGLVVGSMVLASTAGDNHGVSAATSAAGGSTGAGARDGSSRDGSTMFGRSTSEMGGVSHSGNENNNRGSGAGAAASSSSSAAKVYTVEDYPPFSVLKKFNLPGSTIPGTAGGCWCTCPRAYEIAVNYELSTPSGSRCSEQNALAKIAATGLPTYAVREVFVHGKGAEKDGKVEDPQPLSPCGVCEMQLKRISGDVQKHCGGGDISIVMFDRMEGPKRLIVLPMHEVSIRGGLLADRSAGDEDVDGEEVDYFF